MSASARKSAMLAHLAIGISGGGAIWAIGYGIRIAFAGGMHAEIWIVAGVVALGLALLQFSQFLLQCKRVNHGLRQYETMLDLVDLTRRQVDHARAVAENSSLSDWAKRVVYREKDYEFLRDTIESAIVRQDWEAADHLIADLEQHLGYADAARALREKVTQARSATSEEKIAAAVHRVEAMCDGRKWKTAERAVERLMGLFPGEPRIAALPARVNDRRQQFKRKLLNDYDAAVREQNVDHAHELLLELDQYLTANEVSALRESARGVFKARLLQMGVQFSLAVHDKHFDQAIAIGDALRKEFPNSRYAQEIKAMMPRLRTMTRKSRETNVATG